MFIAFLSFTILVLSVIILNILGIKNNSFSIHATYLKEMNMIPTLLCSLSLFLGFKNLNIGCNKVINTISASTFGVYLIHDNYFVGPFLWNTVFQNTLFLDSPFLLLHAIMTTIVIFLGCTIIDQIRLHLLERPLFWLLDCKQESIRLLVGKWKAALTKLMFRKSLHRKI
jgi:surface polysaccharide O-acyltransferase-like enzyme